ncbi:hypothetical protein [Arthrobacter agilis]|uniref:hypothetical protein n=1 Tax=Arthrobacter agilis TaxID=37921 RepID=UPI002787E88A|nr:hypothetical protein [Arthrobacter agilis]MDQ0736608.1 hypothetical protein [Arthrobacter agilis]
MSRHRAPRRLRRVRFLVRVLIAVVVFTCAPTIAQAAFSGAATAPMKVTAYTVPAPVGMTASANCPPFSGTMTVAVTDFGAVDRATSYTLTLTKPGTTTDVAPPQELKVGRTATFTVPRGFLQYPTYTLSIRANVGAWTGKQSLVRDFSC